MESLNLNTLATSLPNGQQKAEKDLTNDFKAAALSITTLYRSSRRAAKRAYNAGYAAACQDLLTVIQQGVSAGGLAHESSNTGTEAGMSIGRIMDWTEARLEEIKAREDEEDEEEEKEKVRPGSAITTKPDVRTKPSTVASSAPRVKENVRAASGPFPTPPSYQTIYNQGLQLPQTPNSPLLHQSSEPPSPSPPPAQIPGVRTLPRSTKPRPPKSDNTGSVLPVTPSTSFNFRPDLVTPLSPPSDSPLPIVAGAKRRHMMMMMDSPTPTISIDTSPTSYPSTQAAPNFVNGGIVPQVNPPIARRRTRSSRAHAHPALHVQNVNAMQVSTEPMDVEEDGRERKRVARR